MASLRSEPWEQATLCISGCRQHSLTRGAESAWVSTGCQRSTEFEAEKVDSIWRLVCSSLLTRLRWEVPFQPQATAHLGRDHKGFLVRHLSPCPGQEGSCQILGGAGSGTFVYVWVSRAPSTDSDSGVSESWVTKVMWGRQQFSQDGVRWKSQRDKEDTTAESGPHDDLCQSITHTMWLHNLLGEAKKGRGGSWPAGILGGLKEEVAFEARLEWDSSSQMGKASMEQGVACRSRESPCGTSKSVSQSGCVRGSSAVWPCGLG